MSELRALFDEEAKKIDPLFYAYRNAVADGRYQLEAGRAYQVAGMNWAARASSALQALGAKADPFYSIVGGRYDVVVKHINEIDAAGFGTKITDAEIRAQFAQDVASGFTDNVKKLGAFSLDVGKYGAVIAGGLAVVVLVLYLAGGRR